MGKGLVIPSFAFKAISDSPGPVASRAVKGVPLVRRLAEPSQPSNRTLQGSSLMNATFQRIYNAGDVDV